jgi:hypothetical protein
MRIAVSLAILVLVCVVLASAQTTSPTAPATVQKLSLSAGETMVSGCLKGSTDGFYLIERDGTMRLLMSSNDSLKPYVDHWVQLGGNRDSRRDSSASSDEGTAHGLRFFQVEEVIADNGTCGR